MADDRVSLHFDTLNESTENFISYSIESDFSLGSDSFEFVLYDENRERLRRQTTPWNIVSIYVNGHLQLNGRIDSRTGDGSRVTIKGRDKLAEMIGSSISPSDKFTKGQDLAAAILSATLSYGINEVEPLGNNLMRSTQTGIPGFQKAPSKDYRTATVSETTSTPSGDVYSFIQSVVELKGFTIQPSISRFKLAICAPEYNQDPSYGFFRYSGDNNFQNTILSGTVVEDWSKVPTVTSCKKKLGHGKGKHFVNAGSEQSTFGPDAFSPIGKNPRIREVIYGKDFKESIAIEHIWRPKNEGVQDNITKMYRPLIIDSKEAKTQEELDNTLRRAIAERLKDTLVCEYTLPGHTDPNTGAIYAIDTTATVIDEPENVNEVLWIESRKLYKSDGGPTLTTVTLIRPEAFAF